MCAPGVIALTVDNLSIYIVHMKAIQIMMDPGLLAELDAMDEVKRDGRSAVLRRAAAEYVVQRRNEEIGEQYRRAYGGGHGLGAEYVGWEDEGSWPDE